MKKNYTVTGCAIMHDGRRYPEGSVIALDDAAAQALGSLAVPGGEAPPPPGNADALKAIAEEAEAAVDAAQDAAKAAKEALDQAELDVKAAEAALAKANTKNKAAAGVKLEQLQEAANDAVAALLAAEDKLQAAAKVASAAWAEVEAATDNHEENP